MNLFWISSLTGIVTSCNSFLFFVIVAIMFYLNRNQICLHGLVIVICIISILGNIGMTSWRLSLSNGINKIKVKSYLINEINQTESQNEATKNWIKNHNCTTELLEQCNADIEKYADSIFEDSFLCSLIQLALILFPLFCFIIVVILIGCTQQEDRTSDDMTVPSFFQSIQSTQRYVSQNFRPFE